jgi:hypothetical protein
VPESRLQILARMEAGVGHGPLLQGVGDYNFASTTTRNCGGGGVRLHGLAGSILGGGGCAKRRMKIQPGVGTHGCRSLLGGIVEVCRHPLALSWICAVVSGRKPRFRVGST